MAADNYVEIFKVTDKDDQHFEIQAKDPEAVAMSEGELTDTVVSFEGAAGDSIGSFTDFINNFVNGTKIGRWFKNFYAGCQYILHVGSLVNNCVTDNAELPLSAAQGKVLMDELTQVKSDLTELSDTTLSKFQFYDGSIAAYSSFSFQYRNQAIVVLHRGGNNRNGIYAFDTWSGISTIVESSAMNIEITIDSKTVTISNNSGTANQMFAIY